MVQDDRRDIRPVPRCGIADPYAAPSRGAPPLPPSPSRARMPPLLSCSPSHAGPCRPPPSLPRRRAITAVVTRAPTLAPREAAARTSSAAHHQLHIIGRACVARARHHRSPLPHTAASARLSPAPAPPPVPPERLGRLVWRGPPQPVFCMPAAMPCTETVIASVSVRSAASPGCELLRRAISSPWMARAGARGE